MALRISPRTLTAAGISLVVTLVSLAAGEGTTDRPSHYVLSAGLLGVHLFLCLLLITAATLRRRGSVVVDFFAPGSALGLFHAGYILVPAYYLWLSLHYDSNWFAVWRSEKAPLFNLTVLVADVGLAGLLLGYRLGLGHPSAWQQRHRSSLLMNVLSSPAGIVILLTMGALTTYTVAAQLGFDITTVLLGLSVSLRDTTPPLPGYIHAGTSFLMWGALLAYWRQINSDQKPLIGLVLCASVFIVQYVVFTGKRSYVAPLVVLPAIWSHYRTRWWTGARVLTYTVAMGSLMVFLLMFRVLAPLYLSSLSIHHKAFVDMTSQPLRSYLDSPDLAMFDVMEACISAPDKVISLGGGWWTTLWQNVVSPVMYVVPRAMWPDKPKFIDLSQVVYLAFFGTADDVGFASGFYGVLYIFGGAAGVLLGSGVLGYVAGRTYNALAPWKGDPGSVFVYGVTVWVLFSFVRFGTIGFTVLNAAQRLGVGVALSLALVIRLHRRRPRLDPGFRRTAAPEV
jgi:hypothetical protein